MAPASVLRTIAVDLTPVLPGGENGGAKIFAMELVRRIAGAHPEARFVLLTQAASHGELAILDAPNVRREQVLGASSSALGPRFVPLAARALGALPAFWRRTAGKLAYALHRTLKRGRGGRLRAWSVDLLLCPFTAPSFREPGIPVVSTIHDLQFADYPQFFSPEVAMQRERALREAARHGGTLAAVSDFSCERAIALGFVAPSQVRTVLHRMGATSQTQARKTPPPMGLAADGYLLYPANYWRHKNHEVLLTAFAMARELGLPPQLRLVLTGAPGARERWLATAAQRLGLGDRVVFAGFLPADEFASLLAHARALVFPSLYEGFGLPLVEAMVAGIPIACSNATALPEVAGDAALLFDARRPDEIARALVSVATDAALRDGLRARGYARAAALNDPDRMAREYWNLMVEAMQGGA